ncbi:hypothetical protein E2C01_010677 [Portunus trituberculatus]|uniref:Uncharacterized protein n=1 Tax=Portunus trituberculatus TaxID=210409 RepID=A0A5B7D934_PORTR|nr:hypothetical protein [Portunus trituberculatus]
MTVSSPPLSSKDSSPKPPSLTPRSGARRGIPRGLFQREDTRREARRRSEVWREDSHIQDTCKMSGLGGGSVWDLPTLCSRTGGGKGVATYSALRGLPCRTWEPLRLTLLALDTACLGRGLREAVSE